MPNSNVLNQMKCPSCNSEGPFKINCSAMFEITDDGSDEHEQLEWTDDSFCSCACGFSGVARDFDDVLERVRERLIELSGYADSSDAQLIDALRLISEHCEGKTEKDVRKELMKLAHEVMDNDKAMAEDLFMLAHWLTRTDYYEIMVCYDDRTWATVIVRAKTADEARDSANESHNATYALHVQKIEEADYENWSIDLSEETETP